MKIIRFLSVTILLVFCIATIAAQSYADEFKGYPITEQSEEELSAFLENVKWARLPADTVPSGAIDSFAAADQSLCAAAMGDEIFIYAKDKVIACYRYDTYGTFKLLLDGKQLVIYEVRGNHLLFVDLDTGAMSLYDLEVDKADLELQSKFIYFGDTQRDATVDGNGYYVINHWKWMNITSSYEKLVYVQNGQETVLHESYANIGLLLFMVFTFILSILIFTFCFRKFLKNKQKP